MATVFVLVFSLFKTFNYEHRSWGVDVLGGIVMTRQIVLPTVACIF